MRYLWVLLWAALASIALAQNTPPTVSLTLPKKAKAGDKVKAVVNVTFAPGLHAYQNPPTQDYMIPAKVESGTKDVKILKVDYPAGEMMEAGGEQAAVYSDGIAIPVQLQLPKKPGNLKVTLKFSYQQCTDTNCFPPASVDASANILIEAVKKGKTDAEPEAGAEEEVVLTTGGPEAPLEPPLGNNNYNPETDAVATGSTPAAADDGGLAGLVRRSFAERNYILLFGLLFVIGLAINLTPCVYPLVPVTISFFSNQAGDNRAARVQLGLMYVVGIAVMYGTVGGLAASLGGTFGDLFTKPWFLVFLGLLMVALALPMFDVYQLNIPPALSKHLKGRSGPVGALIMGLLVGVAAAPCAGPVIVALFSEAAKLNNATLSILIFTTVGLGIGVPYLILGAATAGTKTLPRAGAWMKTVKALLGLLVFGIGLNYLLQAAVGLSDTEKLLVWIAFYLGCAVYLFAFENNGATRFIVGLKGVAILGLGIFAGMALSERSALITEQQIKALGGGEAVANKIDWKPFTVEAFEDAKKSGKPILVDGTADWCAECHKIDRVVFSRPEAIVAMRNVIGFKVDWSTGVDEAYKQQTKKLFQIEGLPHFVFHKPGGERTEIKNHLEDVDELVEALKRAGADL